jgi:hypothetical protein
MLPGYSRHYLPKVTGSRTIHADNRRLEPDMLSPRGQTRRSGHRFFPEPTRRAGFDSAEPAEPIAVAQRDNPGMTVAAECVAAECMQRAGAAVGGGSSLFRSSNADVGSATPGGTAEQTR